MGVSNHTPTIRLYKFIKAEFGLHALAEKRIRVSRIDNLNDDFEFKAIDVPDPVERQALYEVPDTLARYTGMICMSESWESPLMWAHYGDNNTGMALGFDVPEADYLPVEYVEKRPSLADLGLTSVINMSDSDMLRVLTVKAKAWDYEREYRAFAGLSDPTVVNGQLHYFVDFGPQLELKEVILGSRFGVPPAEVANLVEPGVDVFKVCADFEDFKFVRAS